MKTLSIIRDMQRWALEQKKSGASIGFVPTMGFLHAGHASLIEKARIDNDQVVVSIFVNPMQFGPQEDFSRYPRDEAGDAQKVLQSGADILFLPSVAEVYPAGYETIVETSEISRGLCGASRPGHFRGVATVVAKLFNAVLPDRAYFGLKDYQQFCVIRQMVKDLNFPVDVIGLPTMRENSDRLAMSSRNVYLDEESRQLAALLPAALFQAQEMTLRQALPTRQIIQQVEKLLQQKSAIKIEYIQIVHPENLKALAQAGPDCPGVLAVAIRIGSVRLIDNIMLGIHERSARHVQD